MAILSVKKVTDNTLNRYDVVDTSLIPSKPFTRNFGDVNDYIEAHVYTKDGRLLQSVYNTKGYTLPIDKSTADNQSTVNSIVYDPGAHLQTLGYSVGEYKIEYRAYRKKLFDLSEKTFFISELSTDRKELRLITNLVSDSTLEQNTLNFLYEIQSSVYFKDFLLNFGDNKAVNAVNLALDKNTSPYSVLVKLYQPLPAEFDLKSSLWVVDELSEPTVFEVVLIPDVPEVKVEYLPSANFNINLEAHQSHTSEYETLQSLYSTSSQSDYQKILNRLNDKSVKLNIDYTDYANFIHFSSAEERLNNFVYKVGLIESYTADINTLSSITNYTSSVNVSASISDLKSKINTIVEKMDGYENFLYTSNAPTAWPKSNGVLYPITSSQVQTWYGDGELEGQLATALDYDSENQDNLVKILPGYIAKDEVNAPFLTFVYMLGQHFDNVWLYIKSLGTLHNADNSFDRGIPKDIVYNMLRSLGIKLYNNNGNESLYDYFLGAPSGSYDINAIEENISGEDRTKEIYKRIYHNLPYLLKSKGTTRGLKALISTFGIPDTILDVIEYGGIDKFSSTNEYYYDRFNYGLNLTSGSYIKLLWAPLTQNYLKYGWSPYYTPADTIEFRFKTDLSNIKSTTTLLQGYYSGSQASDLFGIRAIYTSSLGVPSANISFTLRNYNDGEAFTETPAITVPIYSVDNKDRWWNVAITRDGKYQEVGSYGNYTLRVASTKNGVVDYNMSASFEVNIGDSYDSSWLYVGSSSITSSVSVGKPLYPTSTYPSNSTFTGMIQEFRFWSEPLSVAAFTQHTLNPESYEGNNVGGAYNDLAARFPLGNNLQTYNHYSTSSLDSVHPNWQVPYSSGSSIQLDRTSGVYGYGAYGTASYDVVSGALLWSGNENKVYFYSFPNTNNYSEIQYTSYVNVPNSGYSSPATNKVRVVDNTVEGEVLLPFLDLQKKDTYRTKDTHFLDVSLSPQTEIDKDVSAQFGTTLNIDNYIGDPKYTLSSSYTGLNTVKADYYKKYSGSYDFRQFVQLVKSFDNSLFKMIEDFAPGRANLSTGITIKSPIIERNKIKGVEANVGNDETKTSELSTMNFSMESSNTMLGTSEGSITGEISGSVIDAYKYFEEFTQNAYALWTESYDKPRFDHSDFNSTYGSVSKNSTSQVRYQLDPYNWNISSSAEIQDFNYHTKRSTIPRYLGSKVTSTTYNFYTPGDTGSYGKTAAIDTNVGKFAYAPSYATNNLNFKDKTTINIKYLINESGSVTELSRKNTNVHEVQNTFKSGDLVSVQLFNTTTPSRQNSLNKSKTIHLGGFSYTPILYRESGENMRFDYLDYTTSISGSVGIKMQSSNSMVWRTVGDANKSFADLPNGSDIILSANGTNISGVPYSSPRDARESWIYPDNSPFMWSMTLINSTSPVLTYGAPAQSSPLFPDNFLGVYEIQFNLFDTEVTSTGASVGVEQVNTDPGVPSKGYTQFTVNTPSTYRIDARIPCKFKGNNDEAGTGIFSVVGVLEKVSSTGVVTYITSTKMVNYVVPGPVGTYGFSGVNPSSGLSGTCYHEGNQTVPVTFDQVIEGMTIDLVQGDEVRLRLFMLDKNRYFQGARDLQFEIPTGGTFQITDTLNSSTSQVVSTTLTSNILTLTSSVTPNLNDTLQFNTSASVLYNNSIFNPINSTVTGSYSSVEEVFTLQEGDIIRLASVNTINAPLYTVSRVIEPIASGSLVASNLQVVLSPAPPSSSLATLNSSFAIIRKVPNETSVILNHTKQDGDVSALLLVPQYIQPKVRDNISNIIQPLKGNLIE